jgi:hypothetical protein
VRLQSLQLLSHLARTCIRIGRFLSATGRSRTAVSSSNGSSHSTACSGEVVAGSSTVALVAGGVSFLLDHNRLAGVAVIGGGIAAVGSGVRSVYRPGALGRLLAQLTAAPSPAEAPAAPGAPYEGDDSKVGSRVLCLTAAGAPTTTSSGSKRRAEAPPPDGSSGPAPPAAPG